jgi:tetratricopeptide (TPR) repeat protein
MRALACSVVGVAIVVGVIVAGPSIRAQPAPDVAHAKELYQLAETAMAEKRFADAARDYGAAYEITKDPVLFYKIGSANERVGKCDVALIYYRRYLREAKPSEGFAALARDRITACGGDPAAVGSGSESGSGSGSGERNVSGAGSAASEVGSAGSALPPPPPAAKPGKHRVAWLLVGGSIATLTIGAVLAYSANAAESDIDDLYVGLNGTPPVFDAKTKARFDDLVSEGERYQNLSRISFGIAGGLAIAAAVKFVLDGRDDVPADKGVHVTPTVSPQGAGVSAVIRF